MTDKPKFVTSIESFSYSPLIVDGSIVKGRVVLDSQVVWESDISVTIEPGFEFNLASVPWWLGFIAVKLGKHQRAACLHDYLYENKIRTRGWADKQFSLAMELDGVKGWRRHTMWLGVRSFGWVYW